MLLNVFKNTVLLFLFILNACGSDADQKSAKNETIENPVQIDSLKSIDKRILVGAQQTVEYLSLLNGKQIGIVANQTSVIFHEDKSKWTHLVDSLYSLDLNIKKVFAPEHGFRGTSDAGELVKDGIDSKTGLPIVSLYGKNKKPSHEQLSDLDVVVFDIQDVGARFYTYISSLHYIMEACAEQNIPLILFDRPNPNGHYVDGPVLDIEHKSFVGMHPVPVVHGMTIGEYAQMINGEKWLTNGVQCDLTIVPVKNYIHDMSYELLIKPSPNLPNDKAINLYPSLCFFEGTNVSAGRGTEMQFQIFGSPFLDPQFFPYKFTPQPNFGSKYPKHQAVECSGLDLRAYEDLSKLNLEWLIEAYTATQDKQAFFIPYFTNLAGTKKLQEQIEQGYTAREIGKSWMKDLTAFKKLRSNYLIYD